LFQWGLKIKNEKLKIKNEARRKKNGVMGESIDNCFLCHSFTRLLVHLFTRPLFFLSSLSAVIAREGRPKQPEHSGARRSQSLSIELVIVNLSFVIASVARQSILSEL
jgi:hypothetical protein